MALSCANLYSRSALAVLYGTGINGVTAVLFSSIRANSRKSLPLCRNYSSSKTRQGIGQHVSSIVQRANYKYESFLKRRFPRFYQLYHTFVKGFRLLFQDAKDISVIKRRMATHGMQVKDLPYRDMEKLRQFRRDVLKAVPLVLISIPPFANYLVFVLMYLFPRHLLVRHFWTLEQQRNFQGLYHAQRAQYHWLVLKGLSREGSRVKDSRLQSRLQELCRKVQSGAHPTVSEVQAVHGLFSGPPLGIKRLSANQMRHICPLLFLTPRLPSFLIGNRLSSHALELHQLDRALCKLGPHQLSDEELKQACFVRGLNSVDLNANQCREWLSQWLQLSTALKESEGSLLLHSMVFLSANYPKGH